MELTYTLSEGEPPRKVYNILKNEFYASAGLIRRLKRSGGITIGGENAFTDRILLPGETLCADITSCEPECDIVPERGETEILWETDGLLAVNKPAGQLVHPSRAQYNGTLSNYVAGYLLETAGFSHCHAVNRLDRDTSGVVLFAKNSYMKERAGKSLSGRECKKEYLAAVLGTPEKSEGTIDAPIIRLREMDMRRGVSPEGKRAVTHYSVLSSGVIHGERVSLLSLVLETGRTHQIRVHMAHIGCPLAGDKLYGRPSSAFPQSGQLLHAKKLTFISPFNSSPIVISAPVTRTDLRFCMSALGFSDGVEI